MRILVTGGTGFIGSETVIALIEKGYEVSIVDNLYNSKKEVLNRIKTLTGVMPTFYEIDCCDMASFRKVFEAEHFDAVIHFAGLKAVGESVAKPVEYYSNNLISTCNLLTLMKEFNVKKLVFSSSATVYGVPDRVPLKETDPVKSATNPYGETKVMIERIITDYCAADSSMNAVLLRYFNPIGAHPSGLLGEDPNGIPNNLMPYICQVAIGKLKCLKVYGDDYPTPDGSGIRDYIHVVDLALGHVATIKKLEENPGLVIYNLGTGKGTSVLEMISAFEKATGVKIPYEIVGRRAGDVAENYAECDKAKNELGWVAKYNVIDACRDAYNFQKKNPNGI
ncbi:MAG: UDP-glucose 4-epimerase GalE [Bacillales bacterium]|nr:UDP-glucose 4-epimerase GalE [Mollicutes bacterium]MCI7212605.1 UDP-glucose 4-epimerase GalE [Bacillales bacterium]MDY3904116.1 UDP-glucose 4-epimerase GalE [Candidatus Enteromonas sp.]MCI7057896.1 UDP-glucose 4-epimerase GalE [Mollicutes bacterium]MDD7714910.1 UDP-glucose 4-epimerase GalE [Mollicutes bacterium]